MFDQDDDGLVIVVPAADAETASDDVELAVAGCLPREWLRLAEA